MTEKRRATEYCSLCCRGRGHWFHSLELFEGHDFVPAKETP